MPGTARPRRRTPIDWPGLENDEGALVGVLCPDCHEGVMDEPFEGLTVLSLKPASDPAGLLPAQMEARGALAITSGPVLDRFRLAFGEFSGHIARRTDRHCRHRPRLAPCIINADDPEIAWCAECFSTDLPDGSIPRCCACRAEEAGTMTGMAVFGAIVVAGALCPACAGAPWPPTRARQA